MNKDGRARKRRMVFFVSAWNLEVGGIRTRAVSHATIERFNLVWPTDHNYVGHNYVGYDYAGRNYAGHVHVAHNYEDHNYEDHDYGGQTYVGHNYLGIVEVAILDGQQSRCALFGCRCLDVLWTQSIRRARRAVVSMGARSTCK